MTFSVSRRPSSSFPSSSSSSFLLFFTLFLLFTFVHPSEGMIDRDGSIECSPNDGLFPAWSFQYEKGGYYSIEIALEQGDWLKHNTTVQVLLMTESQLDPVRSASMEDVCQSTTFNYVGTLWQVTLGANHPTMGEVTIESMPTSDWVRLLILNCDSDEFHFTYNDVAYNPGFEYLSMSQVPYKLLYRAVSHNTRTHACTPYDDILLTDDVVDSLISSVCVLSLIVVGVVLFVLPVYVHLVYFRLSLVSSLICLSSLEYSSPVSDGPLPIDEGRLLCAHTRVLARGK